MKYIIANWKCTKTIADCLSWIESVGPKVSEMEDLEIIVSPPFVALEPVRRLIDENSFSFKIAAQTVSAFEKGAYTGEVAAFMLAGLVEYALLGHSERRSNRYESNEDISAQV